MGPANMQNHLSNNRHGGKRAGAGRKPRFGAPMLQKTVRLPKEWIDQLCEEFGSFQTAIETLASDHLAK
jgi:hypothetical protein